MMTEEARERRRQKDRERYLRQREARLQRQREYYAENREAILEKVRQRRIGIYELPSVSEERSLQALERKRAYDRRYYWTHREQRLRYYKSWLASRTGRL